MVVAGVSGVKRVFALYRSVLREAAKRTVKLLGTSNKLGSFLSKRMNHNDYIVRCQISDDKLGWWSDPSLKDRAQNSFWWETSQITPCLESRYGGTTAWYGYHRRRCDLREPVMPRWCMKKPCLTFLTLKERINDYRYHRCQLYTNTQLVQMSVPCARCVDAKTVL
jgi:hypothetical protein